MKMLAWAALALSALCACPLAAPAIAAPVPLPSCVNYKGQTFPCGGTTIVDGNGNALQAVAQSISGTLSAAGTDGKTIGLRGEFNVTISETGMSANDNASTYIERSFDAGTTWSPMISAGVVGPPLNFFVDNNRNQVTVASDGATFIFHEPEAGVLYRFRVVSITAGSVTYRLSQ